MTFYDIKFSPAHTNNQGKPLRFLGDTMFRQIGYTALESHRSVQVTICEPYKVVTVALMEGQTLEAFKSKKHSTPQTLSICGHGEASLIDPK